ncbi:MAG: adenylate/guanylate cyclase domain-containing protein [Microthrixaceae bacterium]
MNADATPDLSFSSLQLPYRWGEARMTTPEPTFVLPSGTVTFLLTDIEGSTRMWGEETPEDMTGVVLRHLEILGDAVAGHGGVRPQEQGEGDSIVAAFARPSDAVAAALAAQLALHAEPWATSRPPLVRMALHTGEAQLRDDANYAGQAIIRTARLRSIGHGGQILVSGATRDLAVDQGGDTTFTSLGEHRLRDLGRPESVWQLVHPDLPTDFPPLLSLEGAPHNLPASLSPFIGRLDEISKLAQLVGAERLVTATGSGGAGKTRLAQQVGAELLHQFAAGVWWAELAPVGDDDVEATFRAALGISEASANSIEDATVALLDGRSALLIVDNCEHVAVTAADLVGRLPGPRPISTSWPRAGSCSTSPANARGAYRRSPCPTATCRRRSRRWPSTTQSSSSAIEPGGRARTSGSPTTTARRSPRCAIASAGSRWRSSWQRRVVGC